MLKGDFSLRGRGRKRRWKSSNTAAKEEPIDA
jgi:hypothetical protein